MSKQRGCKMGACLLLFNCVSLCARSVRSGTCVRRPMWGQVQSLPRDRWISRSAARFPCKATRWLPYVNSSLKPTCDPLPLEPTSLIKHVRHYVGCGIFVFCLWMFSVTDSNINTCPYLRVCVYVWRKRERHASTHAIWKCCVFIVLVIGAHACDSGVRRV